MAYAVKISQCQFLVIFSQKLVCRMSSLLGYATHVQNVKIILFPLFHLPV